MGTVFSKLLIVVALTRSTNGDCQYKHTESECRNKCMDFGLNPLTEIPGWSDKSERQKAEILKPIIQCDKYDENLNIWEEYQKWRHPQLTEDWSSWEEETSWDFDKDIEEMQRRGEPLSEGEIKQLNDERKMRNEKALTMKVDCCLDQELKIFKKEWNKYKTFYPEPKKPTKPVSRHLGSPKRRGEPTPFERWLEKAKGGIANSVVNI